MNGSIRVSAKTVDDAITEALIQLGVTSDRLEYEVIEKGSAGFLGIGMKQAVIEARRKPEPKEEKVEEPVVEEPVKAEPKKVETVQPQKAAAEKKADEPQKAAFEKAVEKEVKEEVKKETKLVEVQPQTIEAVEDFLKNTMKAMDMEVELKTEIDQDGALCVDMSGEHMGILIGKRGQTLDSLQYLANRVANKHQEGYVRVKLDTENYRARREETLRHLAKNIAHKVKRNRRPVALEPMNPYERRIIHSALQNDKYVTTHSEGEEPFRHVVVTLTGFRIEVRQLCPDQNVSGKCVHRKFNRTFLKNFVVDSHFTQFDERVVIYRRFVDVVQTAVIYLLCVCTCDGDIVFSSVSFVSVEDDGTFTVFRSLADTVVICQSETAHTRTCQVKGDGRA